ncbi:MAG: hypothetical protein JHC64_30000, partial [Mycolicibacterium sp.]|nr:hypothetical protein [Mycolicibacterium sp.]
MNELTAERRGPAWVHAARGAAALGAAMGALVFIGAVNAMMDQLRHHAPHLAGWGFGGVGVGIA